MPFGIHASLLTFALNADEQLQVTLPLVLVHSLLTPLRSVLNVPCK